MKDLYIQGIFNEYMGRRDQARADLNVYLNQQVAIGEHPNIAEEIKGKIEEIEKYDSLVDQMKKLFLDATPAEGAQPPHDKV
tara:strand:- start:754 stop:999 length:246 start_codon:yes stop_codon:yes gene_type:complete